MNTTTEGQRPASPEVKTVLQFLARTNRQLLVFYGSAFTVGSAANRPGIACVALALAGLPHLSMILLSVVDPNAIRALGSDYTAPDQAKGVAQHADDIDDGDAIPRLQPGLEACGGVDQHQDGKAPSPAC